MLADTEQLTYISCISILGSSWVPINLEGFRSQATFNLIQEKKKKKEEEGL